jgi:hypothetical protein
VRCLTGKKTRAIKQARTRLQSSALLLAIALLVHSAAPALRALEPPKGSAAESSEQRKVAKVKAEVARRGVGEKARVRVKLRDKHELKGRITQIDDDSFQLLVDQDGVDAQSAQSRLITIQYADVEKFRGPRALVTSIAMGIGLTVTALAILAGIVIVEAHKHDHCY